MSRQTHTHTHTHTNSGMQHINIMSFILMVSRFGKKQLLNIFVTFPLHIHIYNHWLLFYKCSLFSVLVLPSFWYWVQIQNLMNTFQLHLIWKPYEIYFKDLSLSLALAYGIIVLPLICWSSDCQHSGICKAA